MEQRYLAAAIDSSKSKTTNATLPNTFWLMEQSTMSFIAFLKKKISNIMHMRIILSSYNCYAARIMVRLYCQQMCKLNHQDASCDQYYMIS